MKIGFIGLGTMGYPMCVNTMKKSGQPMVVYDINQARVQAIADLGAQAASSIGEIGGTCDVVITMVPTSRDVQAVYDELLPTVRPGAILIDMSTIEPSVSQAIAAAAAKRGAAMLDAPVVKSKAAAEKGELGIYVGGNKEVYEQVRDILACMGSNIIYLGGNGSGLVMKICHNMLVAQIQNGVNEMLVLAQTAGIDMEDATTAVSYGGGQNFYLDSKKNAIMAEDFTPNFTIQNMNKDINIALQLAGELGLRLPGAQRAAEIYAQAMQDGMSGLDFSATYKIVKKLTAAKE